MLGPQQIHEKKTTPSFNFTTISVLSNVLVQRGHVHMAMLPKPGFTPSPYTNKGRAKQNKGRVLTPFVLKGAYEQLVGCVFKQNLLLFCLLYIYVLFLETTLRPLQHNIVMGGNAKPSRSGAACIAQAPVAPSQKLAQTNRSSRNALCLPKTSKSARGMIRLS